MRWKHFQVFLSGVITDALLSASGLMSIGGDPFRLCRSLPLWSPSRLPHWASLSSPLGAQYILSPISHHVLKHSKLLKTQVKWKFLSCWTQLCNPMDYTVHGILQARILEWVAFPFSRGSSQPRDRTQVTRVAGGFSTSWATRDVQDSSWRPMSKRLLSLSRLLLGSDWWIDWK